MKEQHLAYLDGWRGLAIVFLLIGHFFPVSGINLGALGVNLFFVLSGLLMSQLLFVKAVPIPLFYRRRIARIFPAFFVMLIAVTVWWGTSRGHVAWREVGGAAFFVNNYTLHNPAVMPLGHIWSLSVEEHAYVLLSLIALVSRRMPANPVVGITLFTSLFAAAGVWYWTRYSGPELDFGWWLHSEVSAYGIFLSAGLLLLLKNRTLPTLPWPAFAAMMAIGFALHWWSVPPPVRTIVGVGLFALAVNLLPVAPPPVKAALSILPLRRVGAWSFSIYLWQQPFYLALHRQQISAWLAIALAITSGIISFYFIEQPVRNYLNTRWGTGPGTAPRELAR